jgi:putative FmdB family regulatory protein
VFGFASRDFSLLPHPARNKAARIIGNHLILIVLESARNSLEFANRQVTSITIADDGGCTHRLLAAPASAISKASLMPTYEYRCEKCDQTFEIFQSMKDEALVVCPKKLCRQEVWGEGRVKRLIGTGAGLIFKGSGFYTTDYRSSNYQESAKKESGSAQGDNAKPGADKANERGSSKGEGTKGEGTKGEGTKGEGSKGEGSKGEGSKSGSSSDKVAGSSGSTPSTSS